jgi:hypothetical protein
VEIDEADGVTRFPIPYEPAQIWTLDNNDGTLWTGYNGEYRIAHTTFAGDTLLVIERMWEPVKLSDDEQTTASEWLRNVARGVDTRRVRIPDTKPAFTAIYVDELGYVWVQPSQEQRESYAELDIFAPNGAYLGRVSAPDRISLREAFLVRSGHLYSVVHDDLGVPYVTRYRIDRYPFTGRIRTGHHGFSEPSTTR